MKIRVIVPFMDKQFNNEITRMGGDIIDTEDAGFKCDEALAQERIDRGYCELVKEDDPQIAQVMKLPNGAVIGFGPFEVKEPEKTTKPVKKGKKASKKK